MPSQTFSSFEAFFDANRHANLRPMLLGRDRGNWGLTHLIVNTLSVQWGQAGGKAVVDIQLPPYWLKSLSIYPLTLGKQNLVIAGTGCRRTFLRSRRSPCARRYT